MMAIMLGICVVGGVIFFAMWDYWISQPSPAGIIFSGGAEPVAESAVFSGVEVPVKLDFIESPDFRDLVFNALPGEPGNNPTITASVGDKIIFDVNNAGKSFHAFGVVSNPDDFNSVIFDSAINSASNPLKAGESGSVTFLAGAPGTYYYICTVPGHALQGMQGSFIVE